MWLAVVLALFCALGVIGQASAQQEARTAPGGLVDPVGASGLYACSVGDAREIAFRVTAFEDGQYKIEERAGSTPAVGVARYPWQLATATLFRERVTARGARKFRRLTGSLRSLHELVPGQRIAADYAEAPLDGASRPLEWRYEIAIGARVASFAPSGLGEVEIVPLEETRVRYVDGQGAPLALSAATAGFERREVARVAYAPALGVALRIERRVNDRTVEACSLAAYTRP